MKTEIRKWIKSKKELLQWDLHKEYYKKAKKAIKEKDELFFYALEAFLKANHKQKMEFAKKILGVISLKEFVVEEEINKNNQFLGDNFLKNIWNQARKKCIPLNVLNNYSVKEYKLPKKMDSISIQNVTSVFPEEEQKFWAILNFLTVNIELGSTLFKEYKLQKDKVYFLHVNIHVSLSVEKIFVVRVAFNFQKGKWEYRSRDFISSDVWANEGDIFLYLVKTQAKKP